MLTFKEFLTENNKRKQSDVDHYEMELAIKNLIAIIRIDKSWSGPAADIWHDVLNKSVDLKNPQWLKFLDNTFFPLWQKAGWPKYPSKEYMKNVQEEWEKKYIRNTSSLKTKDKWWEKYI